MTRLKAQQSTMQDMFYLQLQPHKVCNDTRTPVRRRIRVRVREREYYTSLEANTRLNDLWVHAFTSSILYGLCTRPTTHTANVRRGDYHFTSYYALCTAALQCTLLTNTEAHFVYWIAIVRVQYNAASSGT